MILIDTSIWIDHFHAAEPALVEALRRTQALGHPMVAGELALGSLRDRAAIHRLLDDLPQARVAMHGEVMRAVERRTLYGRGLGLVDAHILASTLLTPGASLWTRDKRLRTAAAELGVAATGVD